MEEGINKKRVSANYIRCKKGFSILETVVVLAVMAIVFGVTASSLFFGRDSARMRKATDDVVSLIREAQSKAISTTPNVKSDIEVKAWRIVINNTNVSLESLVPSPASPEESLVAINERTYNFPDFIFLRNYTPPYPGVTSLDTTTADPNDTLLPLYITFTAPFGQSYQSEIAMNDPAPPTSCHWTIYTSLGPPPTITTTKEYIPSSYTGADCRPNYTSYNNRPAIIDSSTGLTVPYTYRLQIRKEDIGAAIKNGPLIKIYSTGDVSIEGY